MKIVWTGLESSGKSLQLSRQAEKIRKRNETWLKIRKRKKLEPNPRTMAFSQPMSLPFIEKVRKSGLNYVQFRSFHEIEDMTDTDFFIDELLKFFPARGTEPLPYHVMEFLTQGAKSGNHIFATSQDFSQVHKQFRLLTNKVYTVRKMAGSPRPINSMPPVNSIWGICIKTSMKPSSFKGDMAEMQPEFIPIPFMIQKADALRYDTLYKVPQAKLPDKKLRPQLVYKVDETGERIDEKIEYKER
jgi:hypothetical protein